jgi:hypothetical protein
LFVWQRSTSVHPHMVRAIDCDCFVLHRRGSALFILLSAILPPHEQCTSTIVCRRCWGTRSTRR